MPDTESSLTGGHEHGLHDNILSYSELLFSSDINDDHLDAHGCFSFTSPVVDHPQMMLCFGDSVDINYGLGMGCDKNVMKFVPKTEASCINDSSSVPSTINSDTMTKKSDDGNGAPASEGTKRNNKKTKSANNLLQTRHAKVKKAKLGERILALQQLVSPFGKTDTASVLHEAKGYITFLQEQVHLLCAPYLQLPIHQEGGEKGRNMKNVESRKDLRSIGLCLIPTGISSLHFTDDNGADYRSPTNALV